MSAAATTPRVRTLVICDQVSASDSEDGVYSLEGVRYEVFAATFPHPQTLSLYLLLSSPREGVFTCIPVIAGVGINWLVRYQEFRVGFAEANDLIPITVTLGQCAFPQPGNYIVQIFFVSDAGVEVLKGEQTFRVHHQVE